jgi:hypothetical protein
MGINLVVAQIVGERHTGIASVVVCKTLGNACAVVEHQLVAADFVDIILCILDEYRRVPAPVVRGKANACIQYAKAGNELAKTLLCLATFSWR